MLDEKFLIKLQKYVDRYLNRLASATRKTYVCKEEAYLYELPNTELDNFIKNNMKPTFSQVLLSYIDKKEVKDSDVYKKAGIDRRHFSKIRSNLHYRPKKTTVIALALALELDKKETDKLLSSAGYSLSDSDLFDLVIKFCIKNKVYDFYNINQALDYFSLKPLI